MRFERSSEWCFLLQVTLKLSGNIEDQAFHLFIKDVQSERGTDNQLSAEQIIALYRIKTGLFKTLKPELLQSLERNGLITREGGHSLRYSLPRSYQLLSNKEQNIGTRYIVTELSQFLIALQLRLLPIGDLEKALAGALNRNQIRYLIAKLYQDKVVVSKGTGRGTKYELHPD